MSVSFGYSGPSSGFTNETTILLISLRESVKSDQENLDLLYLLVIFQQSVLGLSLGLTFIKWSTDSVVSTLSVA